MKHGRRHSSLKEKVYRERASQEAEGYTRPYAPIDVREPDAPIELPDPESPIGARLSGKTRRGLKRLGVETEVPSDDRALQGEPETDK